MAIRVYTKKHCGACKDVIALLRSKQATFEEIDLSSDDEERARLEELTGWDTLPMVFVDEVFIGGWDDLEELDASGELDLLLDGSPAD
jgi:glutaredoxin 3